MYKLLGSRSCFLFHIANFVKEDMETLITFTPPFILCSRYVNDRSTTKRTSEAWSGESKKEVHMVCCFSGFIIVGSSSQLFHLFWGAWIFLKGWWRKGWWGKPGFYVNEVVYSDNVVGYGGDLSQSDCNSWLQVDGPVGNTDVEDCPGEPDSAVVHLNNPLQSNLQNKPKISSRSRS